MPGPTRRRRQPAKYRQIAHMADVAFRIRGESLAEIYINAAEAMTATMADRRRLRLKETRHIEVEAPDREALLVSWLNYLLYLYDVEGFLGRLFEIVELREERLRATARGEIFDPERHEAKTAVKAATYHHLEITPRNHSWQATVILDL